MKLSKNIIFIKIVLIAQFSYSAQNKCLQLFNQSPNSSISQTSKTTKSPRAGESFSNEKKLNVTKALSRNNFTIKRGFRDYAQAFHEEFQSRLASLTRRQAWLNVGGGLAEAEFQFLEAKDSAKLPLPKVISFAVKQPKKARIYPKNHRYVEGFIENATIQELGGKFDVITDNYSALSYSRNLTGVIQKYLDLLTPNGKIYITSTGLNLSKGSFVGIKVLVGDKQVTVPEWLSSIPGLIIKDISLNSPGTYQSFSIEVEPGKKPKIPQLELVGFVDHVPPIMRFAEINPGQQQRQLTKFDPNFYDNADFPMDFYAVPGFEDVNFWRAP